MTDELDTEYTHEIVCPYCEYEYTHSDEYKSLIQHCISCQKCFLLDIHHKITYSSKRAPCLNGESDHDYEPFGNCNNYLCIICGQLEENPTKTEFNNIGLKGHSFWGFIEERLFINPPPPNYSLGKYPNDQFTGKFDIHEKEIYEGDIVRGICSNNPAYVCEGLKQSGMMGKEVTGVVEYSDLYAQFYVTTDGITYLDFQNGITNIEVIGNKYENPDSAYLHSIPGMVESIKKSINEPIDKCVNDVEYRSGIWICPLCMQRCLGYDSLMKHKEDFHTVNN